MTHIQGHYSIYDISFSALRLSPTQYMGGKEVIRNALEEP